MGNSFDALAAAEGHREQGAKAKRMGTSFEDSFETWAVQTGWACTRIPDGCRTFGRNRLARVRTPFDYILSRTSQALVVDTKTSQGKRFPHSKIDLYQVSQLILHEKAGIAAGYVIQLREANTVIFVKASVLLKRHYMGEGSISIEDSDVSVIGNGLKLDLSRALNNP